MLGLVLTVPARKWALWSTVTLGTAGIVANYGEYLPPNFQSDFLWGRQDYFYGLYAMAFCVHVLAGPLTLLIGLLLLSDRFRQRWPAGHRALGRVQVATVLLLLCPSGLVMSRWAMTGNIAALGFTMLSLLTAFTILMGWRAAVHRRFEAHRRWMLRCFALLCSAIVPRLMGGMSSMMAIDGTYPFAAWASWLLPLAIVEWRLATRRRPTSPARQSSPSH